MTDAPKKPGHPVIAVVLALIAAAGLFYASVSVRWLYNPRTVGWAQEVRMGPRGTTMCNKRDERLREELDLENRCYDEDTFVKLGATCSEGCLSMSNGTLVTYMRNELEAARKAVRESPNDTDAAIIATKLEKEMQTSGAWTAFGWIALISCMLAAFSLFSAAVLVIARKRYRLPIMPTTTALLGLIVGLVAGPVFVAIKPGGPGFVGVGLGDFRLFIESLGFWGFAIGVVLGLASALMLNKLLRPIDHDFDHDADAV